MGIRHACAEAEQPPVSPRLQRFLGLEKGSVTPLGVLNDRDHVVEVFLDSDLDTALPVGVHPLRNTATVFLPFSDLARLVRENGNALHILAL